MQFFSKNPRELAFPGASSTESQRKGIRPKPKLTSCSRKASPSRIDREAVLPCPHVGPEVSSPRLAALFSIACPTRFLKIDPRGLPRPSACPLCVLRRLQSFVRYVAVRA